MYQIVLTSEFIRSLRDSTGVGGARATCDLAPCAFPAEPTVSAPRRSHAPGALQALAIAFAPVLRALGAH